MQLRRELVQIGVRAGFQLLAQLPDCGVCPAQHAAHPLFLEFACPDFLCGGCSVSLFRSARSVRRFVFQRSAAAPARRILPALRKDLAAAFPKPCAERLPFLPLLLFALRRFRLRRKRRLAHRHMRFLRILPVPLWARAQTAPPGAGAPRSRRPGRGFRLAGCLQECPPARPEMPAASGCMPEAARLPPVPARDTPFVFSAVFSALYAGFYNQRSDFSKSSCDWSICRSSASWNTSSWTSLNIWITTATTGSRQN